MANKPLDSSGQSGKMLKASAKDVREQQGKSRRTPLQRSQDELIAARMRELDDAIRANRKSVIITPDPPARCIWCSSQPVSPEHDPYCSSQCAAAAEADNAVD